MLLERSHQHECKLKIQHFKQISVYYKHKKDIFNVSALPVDKKIIKTFFRHNYKGLKNHWNHALHKHPFSFKSYKNLPPPLPQHPCGTLLGVENK